MGNLKEETTDYPDMLDTAVDIVDGERAVATQINGIYAAIIAMQTEMGAGTGNTSPKGSDTSLAARLNRCMHADGGVLRYTADPTPPIIGPHFYYNTLTNTLRIYNPSTAGYDEVTTSAILAGYVRTGIDSTVTATITFNPSAASTPPFAIGANATDVLVTGLNADKTDGYDANTTGVWGQIVVRDANGGIKHRTNSAQAGTEEYLFEQVATDWGQFGHKNMINSLIGSTAIYLYYNSFRTSDGNAHKVDGDVPCGVLGILDSINGTTGMPQFLFWRNNTTEANNAVAPSWTQYVIPMCTNSGHLYLEGSLVLENNVPIYAKEAYTPPYGSYQDGSLVPILQRGTDGRAHFGDTDRTRYGYITVNANELVFTTQANNAQTVLTATNYPSFNLDVPNADYADDANTVDGVHADSFVRGQAAATTVKYGYSTTNGTGIQDITFSSPFASACWGVHVTMVGDGSATYRVHYIKDVTAAGFRVHWADLGGVGAPVTYYWFAVGF